MRVLLDENLDRRLGLLLADEHEAVTVAERGWRGMKNGDLLRAAEGEFGASLTRGTEGDLQRAVEQVAWA